MKPKNEFPKYIYNGLCYRQPDTIFVSTKEEWLTVEKYEIEDGNNVFQTKVFIDNECSDCYALIITFGISCIIDRIVVLCPEHSGKMIKKQKKLLERYNF